MLTVGGTIRILMDEQGITVPRLAELTGLKESAVLNVIYNRANKAGYLSRIAKALSVPLENILQSKKTLLLDTKTYFLVTKLIGEVLEELSITLVPSQLLNEYTESLYKAMLLDKDAGYNKAYLKGMIESHIKFGLIKSGIVTEEKVNI